MLSRFLTFFGLCLGALGALGQTLPDGYDVVLLVGQSNMAGTGTGADNPADAAADPRVWQWDAANGVIAAAIDPLVQNPTQPGLTGLGLTFGKAYAASLPANRKVLLVGSAAGGTSFISGRWQAPNGDLALTAVARANAALVAAGPGARFVGILWHQGESDITDGGAPTYQANLSNLVNFFRTRITGASGTTPFIAGEFTYPWLAANSGNAAQLSAQDTILNVIHALPDTVPYSGWVSSAGLGTDSVTGIIHFNTLALRDLGRRYAQRFLSVANNLLVNGGFETNDVPAGSWTQPATLAGWQTTGGVFEVWRNLNGWAAVDGNSWIELDAAAAADTISQKVTTTAGDLLQLRFWYSARPGTAAATNRFDVLWNGVVIDTLAPEGSGLTVPLWQSKAYAVTATGSDTLAFRESGVNDGVGTLIDAVTLASLGTGTHPAMANVALGKAASQSSVLVGGVPARAVDGNTDGNWANNSVTHTNNNPQEWWQVDLGTSQWVQGIRLYNRTDCCADRLANFDVLVSPSDMSGRTLAQLRADPTVLRQQVPLAGALRELAFGVTGRYVRVQLAGTNNLSLAEVQVLGWPAGGLSASYFNNTSLSGTPVLQRTENVDFDWGAGSPAAAVPVDNFSARWTGSLLVPTTGSYNFATVSDDGVRVWINGTLVIDNWTPHGPTTNTASGIPLTAGQAVSVRIEYFEASGGATIRWQWQPPGASGYLAVPSSALSAN